MWLAIAALAVAGVAGVPAGAEPKPPKPKPKLELMTTTQEKVLERRLIKVRVDSKRGDRVTAKGTLVIDGYPDDFPFKLATQRERLRKREANVKWRLNAREREVLDFAIKSCRPATVKVRARIGKGKRDGARLHKHLKRPAECRPG